MKITPILQSAEEFDWGRQRWDLIALLYFHAVRENMAKVRESLRPGGLVVVEAFLVPPGSPERGVEYRPGELRKLFDEGFETLRYEETEGVADYGQKPHATRPPRRPPDNDAGAIVPPDFAADRGAVKWLHGPCPPKPPR